ncbi:hypothetical protein CBM2613_A250334 [Cupriavidus taiwanensis]|uniref:Uncharacterized protein n=1 Tax=Cupriavidus taiwanensis TaxID=164546 RepID=A0A976AWR5_9BURK|nr:hypothetical protein CBM2613_A250334 [Cupriavidus taiwanensis]
MIRILQEVVAQHKRSQPLIVFACPRFRVE